MGRYAPCIIVEELDYIEDPTTTFEALINDIMPFLLESALVMERYGRYSIMGSNPDVIIRSKNGMTEVTRGNTTEIYKDGPLKVIDEETERFGHLKNLEDTEGLSLPFTGGAVGYFGYDLNRQIERMPNIAVDDQQIPDIYLGLYREAIVVDHAEHKGYAVAYVPKSTKKGLCEAKTRLQCLIEKIPLGASENGELRLRVTGKLQSTNSDAVASNLSSNFTRTEYRQMIEAAKRYIYEGDIFQVNLSQRFTVDLHTGHWPLYKCLRAANPAPFAAFLGYGEFSILSSSPERFMFVDGRHVETRPIKGTRPRFADAASNKASIQELKDSEKDAAEHVMIVDVKRNDLGRVCVTGSVCVPELMVLESYKSVHHLVSTIVGQLRADVGAMDLLRASFPGGSISGAPKIRAMEIIEGLEPHRRNLYTGSIGYISTNGKMDTNIVIRTLTALGDKAYFQVGGGIVADSDPDAEYIETLDKGRAIFEALGMDVDD
ncbi:MAG TPA: aminodeoxychorismate synthase component I [Candidatus Aquicultor sp.]